jgi:hypothetical protein
MRKLLVVLVLLVGLGVAAEAAVIPLAESKLEQQVGERTDGEAAVSADIDSFPMITRVLLTGRVKELSVTLEQVARQTLTFTDVRFDVFGIEVDRPAILRREVKITAIDSGTVTATLDLGRLGTIVSRLGSFLGTDVRVEDGVLRVGSASFPIDASLFPCAPDANVEGEKVTLSCTIDEVPEALLDAVSDAMLDATQTKI